MSVTPLKDKLSDFAKDIKLNFANILTEEGATDLTQKQIYYIALTVAYASKDPALIKDIYADAKNILADVEIQAAKSAASIMAMNNVYYRFIHLVNDEAFVKMPAKLRMNVIANPGIDKVDFELGCLAVSALNGCGMCIEAHSKALIKADVSKLAIQSAVRIAAVLNAVSTSIAIANNAG